MYKTLVNIILFYTASSKPAQQNANLGKSPSGFVRPAPRYNTKSNMTRSSSVGVLNNQVIL